MKYLLLIHGRDDVMSIMNKHYWSEIWDFKIATTQLQQCSGYPYENSNATPTVLAARIQSPPRAGLAFFIEILAPLRPRSLIWCVATSSL